MLWVGLFVLGLLGFRAIPNALLRPLKNRYPVPTPRGVARDAGMIVLGDATGHPDFFLAYRQVLLGEAAERMRVLIGLMRQYPELELVFSGGEERLRATGTSEAEMAGAVFERQRVEMARLSLEGSSRNTRENAIQVPNLWR